MSLEQALLLSASDCPDDDSRGAQEPQDNVGNTQGRSRMGAASSSLLSTTPISTVVLPRLSTTATDDASPSQTNHNNNNSSSSSSQSALNPITPRHRIASLRHDLATVLPPETSARFDGSLAQLELDVCQRESELVQRACQLRARDDEITAQRAQIRGLKEWVSSSTRAGGQVGDGEFADAFGRVANALQNWVVVNFRRVRIDVPSREDDCSMLRRLVPDYESMMSSAKIHLLQSIVSAILYQTVFDVYLCGLNEEATSHVLRAETTVLQITSSTEAANQWRAATVGVLTRDQQFQSRLSQTIDEITTQIWQTLDTCVVPAEKSPQTPETPSPVQSRSARDTSSLGTILANAGRLAHQLRSQRALYRVISPAPGHSFDPALMDDVGAMLDSPAVESSDEQRHEQKKMPRIKCVVFPALVKHGDENGAQLHLENVLVKASVLCFM